MRHRSAQLNAACESSVIRFLTLTVRAAKYGVVRQPSGAGDDVHP